MFREKARRSFFFQKKIPRMNGRPDKKKNLFPFFSIATSVRYTFKTHSHTHTGLFFFHISHAKGTMANA